MPYNLFRLFLVHKISASKYIYENGKKKREKKKKKGFPASWAGGDFGPPGASARARVGVLAAQLAQPRGSDGGGRRRGARPTRQGEGVVNGVDGNGRREFQIRISLAMRSQSRTSG